MKIEFEDGSFLQIDAINTYFLELIQCAKKDRKVVMSSVKLNQDQIKQLIDFLNNWMKGNNE